MTPPPSNTGTSTAPPGAAVAAQARPATPRLSSRDLLGGRQEIEIVHGMAVYRLRVTAQGKLILTK